MEKLKKIAKYTTNVLGIVAALIAGFNSVDGITIPYAIQIVQCIAVVQGVIRNIFIIRQSNQYNGNKGGGKIMDEEELQNTFNDDPIEELLEEGEIENADQNKLSL